MLSRHIQVISDREPPWQNPLGALAGHNVRNSIFDREIVFLNIFKKFFFSIVGLEFLNILMYRTCTVAILDPRWRPVLSNIPNFFCIFKNFANYCACMMIFMLYRIIMKMGLDRKSVV